MTSPFTPGSFVWIAGIEDTCVYPPEHFAMQPLDEHALTGHDEQWRADLDCVAALGARALRYGVDWPRVHLAPEEFDWSVLDERLAYARSLGITVIADLVHYGTPTWLDQSFVDPRYPDAIGSFAGAFAARYAGIVDHITPLNEPVTTASFAGLRGVWPPALHGWDGWTRVVLGIAQGMQEAVRAARESNPDVTIVHVEATSAYSVDPVAADNPDGPALLEEAALLNALGFLPTDLLLGLVDERHPARPWLLEQGATADALRSLVDGGVAIDVLGVNFYPDLSPRRLVREGGVVVQHAWNGWTSGLERSFRAFGERYGLPMLLTETSIEGDDDLRSAWAGACVATVRALVADGLDVRGWTWWPVFDFVDWSYASGGRNVEEFAVPDDVVAARQHAAPGSLGLEPYLRRMGLVRLDPTADGGLARTPTGAADAYRALVDGGDRVER